MYDQTHATCSARQISVITGNRPSLERVRTLNTSNLKVLNLSDNNISKFVCIGVINAGSVRNKTDELVDHLNDHKLDIVAITETWLAPGDKDQKTIRDLTPSGYEFVHRPRKTRGGGVGLLYRSSFKVTLNKKQATKSFEYMDLDVVSGGRSLKLVVIYRPPPSGKNRLRNADFIQEFTNFMEPYVVSPGHLLVVGDFNIHVDDPSNVTTVQFTDLINTLDIEQHVQQSTHLAGHILDLMLSPRSETVVISTETSTLVTDHMWVHCVVNLSKPPVVRNSVTYRKYRQIDAVSFRDDKVLHTSPHASFVNSI